MTDRDKPEPSRGPGRRDPGEIASTGATDEEEIAARAANRFDIRRIIGALFELYGVVLTITGIVGSHAVKTKAAGINIDLWTGVAMIVFGALMIGWALWRPTVPEPTETRGQSSGRIRRAPAT